MVTVPLRLSGESVTINDHVAGMEHIYQCMLAKAPQNIEVITDDTVKILGGLLTMPIGEMTRL